MKINKMRAICPGEILADEMDVLKLSANQLAQKLSVPANRISAILNGTRIITADTALRFSRFFGTTPEFWLNLQNAYDLKIIPMKLKKRLLKEVQPLVPIELYE